jgi:GTP-binding protein
VASDNFIDYVKIFVRSGDGGAGSRHFFRAKGLPNGGPDGGNGGRGGHIIVHANPQHWTLFHLKYTKHMHADNGQGGAASNCTGADGQDRIIEVPIGTVIKDAETGEVVLELDKPNQKKILLAGGRGGLGNTNFKTSTNQAPDYAQPGDPIKEGWYIFELKLLADVGLVGFPNAGKSTLLSAVSEARPKIDSYPFTTLTPNLGVVAARGFRSFVMADIPGIIEGASEGKGLGLRFLKHIERNSILLFLIPADEPDYEAALNVLFDELEAHNPDLLAKPRLIAVSKADLMDEEGEAQLAKLRKKYGVLLFSAVTQQGVQELKDAIWEFLNANRPPEEDEEEQEEI